MLANTNFSLGYAYVSLDKIKASIECLNKAEHYFRAVTRLDGNASLAEGWQCVGECCLNIGERHCDAKGKHDVDSFEKSILAFKQALAILNIEHSPEIWEYNQYKLGRALQSLGIANSDCQSLLDSVSAFSSALECTKNSGLKDYYECYYDRSWSKFIFAL